MPVAGALGALVTTPLDVVKVSDDVFKLSQVIHTVKSHVHVV